MPSLLHNPTCQSELFEQLRAGRIIVPNQLPALITCGERRIAAAITITLGAQRLAIVRVFEHCQWPQLFVVLGAALAAPAIPTV